MGTHRLQQSRQYIKRKQRDSFEIVFCAFLLSMINCIVSNFALRVFYDFNMRKQKIKSSAFRRTKELKKISEKETKEINEVN